MARKATETNTPESDSVKEAVSNIETRHEELASERGVYMQKCKRIREQMADHYDHASDRGISKKLLKKIIKERELERRIAALTDDLENDERSELEMLIEKLGDLGTLPLGQAALAAAEGKATLKSVGA